MPIMKNKYGAFLLLIFGFFLWGSSYVASKLISPGVTPQIIACARCAIALIPLFLMAKPHLKTKIENKDIKYFFIIGGVGYYMNISLLQLGTALTSASIASLMTSMMPVSVTIFAAILLHEKITVKKCVCVALALAGTAIIAGGTEGGEQVTGIICLLGSIVLYGVSSVIVKKLTAKYPPILITAYCIAISMIFFIPTAVVSAIGQPPAIKGTDVLLLLYIGIFSTGLGQFLWNRSLSKIPASTCSMFYPLQTVFSVLLGLIFLEETFPATYIIGFLLIAADVFLSLSDVRKEEKMRINH